MSQEILIVGNRGGSNVGESLFRASLEFAMPADQMEPIEAMNGPVWLRRAYWLYDRRPVGLEQFAQKILRYCEARRPALLLCMGITPLTGEALHRTGELGVRRAVYLTDDPWNPAHRPAGFCGRCGLMITSLRHAARTFPIAKERAARMSPICRSAMTRRCVPRLAYRSGRMRNSMTFPLRGARTAIACRT